ncbi:MAG: UDP-4-amino-4,6-dideoxy-N-acetyl-beta-L-altrosamine transaminase [Lachnospiraceae bacterium]|nr:UDP-4-amino-4,6-dideoxy-N-acetyl-beta-L-altrosamine transaminase [Lachnospiraceae bacterium]
MEKLAIHGGTPIREHKISYGRQCIEEDDIQAVTDVLKSDYLTCGPKVDELERALCDYTGAKYAVAVSNGTAALHCACIAAGIGPGDEVITTPITFAASANCALYCGATPVFADIDPDTYNIAPESIREHITEKTKAVVAVDFTGQVVEIEEIRKICDEYHLLFIEDAAHSIGSSYDGKMVGSLADITTFSFHPVKTVTGGEGGAVLTNRKDIYDKIYLAHVHGITHDAAQMMEDHPEGWYYEQVSLGYNYRLTDFQAALVLSQLSKIERFKARRRQIVNRYNEAFAEIPQLIVQKEISQSDTCRHLYILRLALDRLKCSRLEFFNALAAENIQPQVHYVPVYWFPHYQKLGFRKGCCPVAEKVYEGIMSIPLYPAMTDQDVEDVIRAVKKVVEYYAV